MLSFRKLCAVLVLILGMYNVAKAAFTITTVYTNQTNRIVSPAGPYPPTGPAYLTFSLQNTNPYAVALTDVGQYHDTGSLVNVSGGGTAPHDNDGATYSLIYTTTNISGTPVVAGWTIAATSLPIVGTFAGIMPILSGLNISIPANTTYRFAVVLNNNSGMYGATTNIGTPSAPILIPPSPSSFSSNGVTLFATADVDQHQGQYPANGFPGSQGWLGFVTLERAGPVINITNNNTCEGGDITLSASAPGVIGATYTWTGPLGQTFTGPSWTLTNVTQADAGVYKVYYTVNGENSVQSTITVTVSPTPPPPNIVGKKAYCINEQFQPLIVGGTDILWYNSPVGGTAVNIPPYVNTTVAGAYTFYATQTVNGCESRQRTPITITVAPKPNKPIVTSPIGFCENDPSDSLKADGQNLTWFYSPVGGLPSVFAPTPNTSVRDTTKYWVSQTIDGCESERAEIEVQVTFRPNGLIVVSRKPEICDGDTLSFYYYGSGTGSTAYNWNLPPSAEYISGEGTAGPFTVRFNNPGFQRVELSAGALGCYSEMQSQPVEVKQIPSARIAAEDNYCKNATNLIFLYDYTPVTIDSFLWDWDGGYTTHYSTDQGPYGVIWPEAGTKAIQLTLSARGCRDTMTDTVVVHESPDARILGYKAGDTVCAGDSLLLQVGTIEPASTYSWSPTRFFDLNDNIPVTYARVDFNSSIRLKVTDEYGCTNSDSIIVFTKPCCGLTLPNAFSPNGDGRNDKFRILTPGFHDVATFRIMNRWGQTVFETADQRFGWDGNMSGKPQDIGNYVYYIKYKCNGKYTEQKGEVMLIR